MAPENTVMAFEQALGYGADVLEVDVRLSRDGHLMVTHDARVERTCNGQGLVIDQKLKDLKRLDAGFHFRNKQGKPYRGQGIRLSTLDELFELFPGRRINIDIKDKLFKAAEAVAESIAKANCQAVVNVGSFHANTLSHFRIHAPQVTTSATQREVAQLYFSRSQGAVKKLPFDFLQIPVSYFGLPLARKSFIHRAQSHGLNVVYWTINTKQHMQTLIDRGINGLVTDRVDIACELLSRTSPKQAK